jgi:hypothetical protein
MTAVRTRIAVAICAALAACAPKPKVQVAAPGGEWLSLFDGHDLDGWTAKSIEVLPSAAP